MRSNTNATIRVARRWLNAKWFPDMYDSWEEWREEWQDRIQHGDDNPRWDTIARGIKVENYDKGVPLALARKIQAGKASAKEVLSLVRKSAGRWWFIVGDPNGGEIEDAEGFAESYDMGLESRDVDWDEDPVSVDISVVLIAERPPWWHPEDGDAGGTMMGNSYIPKHWNSVKLKAVHYWTGGERWTTAPASGSIRL